MGYRFRRTTLLLWFCGAILVGLAGGYFGHAWRPLSGWLLAGGLLVVIGRYRWPGLLAVIMLGLALGGWRGTMVAQQIGGYQPLYDGSVDLQVTANEDAVYATGGQLTFVAVKVIDLDTGQQLPGKIGVKGFGPNAVYQNDVLQVQGKLRSGIGGYQGFISYGQITLLKQQPSLIASLRRQFAAGMQNALPEPLASFGMGLLIGQRATLPDDIKQNLLMVGLTHVIAVSGYNLTIMLDASRKLLGKRSKRMSTTLTLALMGLFVLLTGASPSIIRAAIVSLLSIAAAYYGRQTRPLLIIVMTAAITAWLNPIYLWSDASWYLSFLAFFGVLMVSPLLQHRLPAAFERSVILGVAIESICAEIMSLPYVLFTFGQMSFIGLPANMLVVSLVPLAMLLCLIAGLGGMLLWPLAGWLAWPAKFLLMYMLDTAQLLAHLPGVFVDGIWLSLAATVGLYTLIALMTVLLTFKDRAKSATITDRELFDTS